jgi:hypothetical protein
MNQRKPTAKRAFHGLVGLPPETDEKPAAEAPTKRGRPSTPNPLTVAERQRLSRARRRQVETAPEREKLICRIVKRIKTSEHGDTQMMRRALSKFHDSLEALTLEHIQEIAKQYDLLHDYKGRSSREGRTGTPIVGGEFIDRLERIATKSESFHIYGGEPAPTATEVDYEVVATSKAPMRESKITVWDLLPQISERMFEGEEEDLWDEESAQPTLRCLACGHLVSLWVHARRHAQEMLEGGEKQLAHIKNLEALAEKTGDDTLLVAARIKYRDLYAPHHTVARVVVEEFS